MALMHTLMLGGQLAATAEPDEGIALNVVPVVVEWAASKHIGLRANSIVNLQLTGAETALAHQGGGLTIPVYIPMSQDKRPAEGFYVGPYGGYAVNPLRDGSDTTLALEAGIRWQLTETVTLNLAVQGGASRLERPEDSRWVAHQGFFPSIGVWAF